MRELIILESDLRKIYINSGPLVREELEEMFPNVLKELEVGEWYTFNKSKTVICITEVGKGVLEGYGIHKGEFFSNIDRTKAMFNGEATRANTAEVRDRLVGEAIRRGYAEGNYVPIGSKSLEGFTGYFYYDIESNRLFTSEYSRGGDTIFKSGVWAGHTTKKE